MVISVRGMVVCCLAVVAIAVAGGFWLSASNKTDEAAWEQGKNEAARTDFENYAIRWNLAGGRDIETFLREMPPLPPGEQVLTISKGGTLIHVPRDYFDRPVWLRRITPVPVPRNLGDDSSLEE